MNEKLLIFGASGFVGNFLWEKAKQRKIIALGTTCEDNPKDFLNFNLATDSLSQVLTPDFLSPQTQAIAIILAGVASVAVCAQNQDFSYQVNVKGTIRLISDLQKIKAKIVYISSGAVFDGKSGSYDENSLVNPIIEYGRQKTLVEDFIQKTCRDFLIVRLSKVVTDNPVKKHIFSDFYRAAAAGEPINCFSGETFSPTDAEDVANGIFLLVEKQLRGVYHLAGPEIFTREELAKEFLQALGMSTQLVVKKAQEFGCKEIRPQKMHLNSKKFVKGTGMAFNPMQEVIASFCRKLPEYQHA